MGAALIPRDSDNISVMSIADRTRKILWIKAGGRCSICRVQVATEGTDTDDPSVFGEECHIVGQSPKGPRAENIANVDAYYNLILLCTKHHKQIDDQVSHFTIERLREIKREHETWVMRSSESRNFGSVQLVPDPLRPTPKALKVFTTGSALWRFVEGSMAFYPSWPNGLREEHEDLIADFLDDLRDCNDVVDHLDSFRAKRDAARELGDHIKCLAEAGFLVGARERFCLLTGGVQEEPSPWRVLDIEVQPAAAVQLVNADGTPLNVDQDSKAGD